jgi:chromosomal replication initiator protein
MAAPFYGNFSPGPYGAGFTFVDDMNPRQVWQAALAELQGSMSQATFETWVKNTVAVDAPNGGGRFTIAAPNTFAKEWLDNRFRGQIETTLGRILGKGTHLEVVVEGSGPSLPNSRARKRADTHAQAPLIRADDEDDADDPPAPARRAAARAREPAASGGRPGRRDDSQGEAGGRPGRRNGPPGHEAPSEREREGKPSHTEPASPSRAMSSGRGAAHPPSRSARHDDLPARHDDPPARRRATARPPPPRSTPSDDRWSFESFVVGPSNRFAFAAAQAVADEPAGAYNPLFIHGGVGLGKTHLLQSIAHATEARGLKTLYVTCEQFTNDLIDAIQRRQTDAFRAAYRSNDVLLIDDVQFLAGKESTQDEFFHTFNELHGARKQIVISSDRPPRAIATLEQRLTSRFEWGLIVDVQPPDVETRTAILRTRAAALPLSVPDDVVALLAQRISRNVRELEGALTTVVAYAKLNGAPLTVETVQRALADVTANRARPLQPAEVLDAVAKHYKADPKLLRGKQRDKEIVLPRQVAMYLMREETTASLMEIGRELGGRDHTTVLHGWEKIKHEVEADDRLRRDVLSVRERLLSGGY